MSLQSIALTPRIGSGIQADPQVLLSGSQAAEIRRLLEERGVVTFRKLDFDDQQQLAFARTLGDIIPQGNKGIYKVTLDKRENDRADYLRGAFYWHIDGTTDDVPTRASLLSAKRLSPSGGQTEFANTYAAYDDLPESEKKSLAGLKVVHHVEAIQRVMYPNPTPEQEASWKRHPPKSHPLVWTHRSGRRSLVLGSTATHIEGMEAAAGRKLLDELQAWATQPAFVYRHEWTLGDMLIWDNTGTMHRVVEYALDSGRMMHRTTLVAEEPLV
jgi:alpha-ketoglutarate-dependent taurine dioxygenase